MGRRSVNDAVTHDPLRRLDRFFEPRTSAPAVSRPSLTFRSVGGEEVSTAHGTTLVISRTYDWDSLPGSLSWDRVRTGGWEPGLVNPRLPATIALHRLACVDIETTGLSLGAGTVAFLVGVIHAEPAGLCLRQFLMRDFPEEAAQQLLLANYMSDFDAVCTYNGSRFDLPILRSRGILHRIETEWSERPHLDLLFPVRSVWRTQWPDCRLATAEFRLLGVVRHADCEGWEVPLRYRQFVLGPDESILLDVLEHNAQDLVSLLCLTAAVQRIYREDFDGFGFTQGEMLSLARSLGARGRPEAALRMYREAIALGRLTEDVGRHIRHYVRLLKRLSRWDEARSVWLDLCTSNSPFDRYWAHLEEAKYQEHRQKQPGEALRAAEDARSALYHLPSDARRDYLAQLLETRCLRLQRRQKPA